MKAGDRLLNYEIISPLGKGGLGTVYLARDVNLDIHVALKVINAEFSAGETMLSRLRIGARAAARLRHPNIQRVYYLGRDPATQIDFVVMEFLPGGSLRQRMALRRLSMDAALAVFTSVCEAVDFAHRHGVIHRDLKPENVMFDSDSNLVVTDFDLARITGEARRTRPGQTPGTLYYASPEQLRGEDVDHTTDIYSLGIMLFEMVTGRWPFIGEADAEVVQGHLHEPPPRPSAINPDVPPSVDEAVLRALAKAPSERFPTAWELASAANGRPFQTPTTEIEIAAPAPAVEQPPEKPPPEAALRELKGAQVGQRFAIHSGVSIGFGRAKNDVHIDDPYVSRAHARIERRGDAYVLIDLRSTNGTKLNGKRIEPNVPITLASGDSIEIGDTVLIFEA